MKQTKLIWIIIFVTGLCVRSTDISHSVDTESWREADVSTIARNFYNNGTNIFHPQIAWDGAGPGYTESEFPLYPYSIALLYKIFGIWEPAGRVISFLFSLASLLVFFRISRYLFTTAAALASSFFFSLSPILFVISNSIQPESLMFFFYLSSAYCFMKWLDVPSRKYFWLTILFTALALLCKITAINIGIFFIAIILIKKDWRYFLKRDIIVIGLLSILPSIIWYFYCHRFYIIYGNSMGVSNEYAWIGWDFFTNRHFIRGIVEIELIYVWTFAGPFVLFFALLFTPMIKRQSTVIGLVWILSVAVFYIVAARTSADSWAYYYHIFSIPAFSILMGSSVIEIYEEYSSALRQGYKKIQSIWFFMRSSFIIFLLCLFIFYFTLSSFQYLVHTKSEVFQTSPFYKCKDSLIKIIPEKSLILVNGGLKRDKLGHPHAYNTSYFFYWLNRKGYNISIEDLSIENVLLFKEKGVSFFLAEERTVHFVPGFEEILRKRFNVIYECNGSILLRL